MYHVNPATGEVNPCKATGKKGCPFGAASEHYETVEEAREAYEIAQKTKQFIISLKRDALVTVSGEAGEHNLYRGLRKGVVPKLGEHCDLNYFSEREADQILDRWERPFRTNEVVYSLEQAGAINFYQMAGHKAIGGALRGKRNLSRLETEHLVNLTKALQRTELIAPITLFRGVKGEYARELVKKRPGELIEEKSFSSTTPSEKGALRFSDEEGVMLQIEAPAGLKAIDLGAGLFSIDEDEILIKEKYFRIISKRRELLDGVPLTRITVRPQSSAEA